MELGEGRCGLFEVVGAGRDGAEFPLPSSPARNSRSARLGLAMKELAFCAPHIALSMTRPAWVIGPAMRPAFSPPIMTILPSGARMRL
ncbi:hypothetical protein OHA72_27925 [Dactylosporangium sp. NBC_01737]|uniref:hypothetical protein n=1 Tax=Dactylosporangium sp. NBC_01737 TaxID=2975959 RepID=UPI002E10C32C|nr:hypothetical protein OHA72_27925 [Dactylosporangium sp. NBC_01737]